MDIAILDYGTGNLFSLQNALENKGARVHIVQKLTNTTYDGIVLPGVGSFDPAMTKIEPEQIRKWTANIPVLGICLGMEILFESSQEGKSKGLGIIKGNVVSLPDTMKIPHMGWNNLEFLTDSILTRGLESGIWAYFVHSYMAVPKDTGTITAITDYGTRIPAIVEKDNYIGTQFHPEKSGIAGKKMIENFLGACHK